MLEKVQRRLSTNCCANPRSSVSKAAAKCPTGISRQYRLKKLLGYSRQVRTNLFDFWTCLFIFFSWRSAPAVMGLSACHGHGMQMRLNAKGQLGIGERFVGILLLWESKKVYLQSRSFSDLQQLCQVCRREQLWGEADILPRGIGLWALGLRWGLPDAPAQERQQVLNHQKLFDQTLWRTMTNLILQVLSCERGLPCSDEVRPSAGESQVGLQGQQAVLGDLTRFHEH